MFRTLLLFSLHPRLRAWGFMLACGLLSILPKGAFAQTSMLDPTVTQVVTGSAFSCALAATGGVQCWGSNSSGQLGNGGAGYSSVPVQVSGLSSGVVAISANGDSACALTTSGGVKCWGLNDKGQLGNGGSGTSTVPVDVTGLGSGVAAIAVGVTHACALTTRGGVWCWGENTWGELGNGSTTNQSSPVAVTGLDAGVLDIAAGTHDSCARMQDGTARCWGSNGNGQLGNGTTSSSSVPVTVSGLGNVARLAVGWYAACAVDTAGAAWCWGANDSGQLGNGTSSDSDVPVRVTGLSGVTAIGLGAGQTCATTDTGVAQCWGSNSFGELGDGTTTARGLPANVEGIVSGATQVAPSAYFSCALVNGGVQCWGYNGLGQAGNATTAASTVPVHVVGFSAGVKAVVQSVVSAVGCRLTEAGGAVCAGSGAYGALGNGGTANSSVAVPVTGLSHDVPSVSPGYQSGCAVTAAGGVQCWGYGYYGQLGNGSTASTDVPVDVTGLASGVASVGAGQWFACALTSVGGVKCWGVNSLGQLGAGSVGGQSNVPVDVLGLGSAATALAVGNSHVCALLADATVSCWGAGMGNGQATSASSAQAIGGLTGVVKITAGNNFSCAILTDGTLRCWGRNLYGVLGNGTTTDSLSPVTVASISQVVDASAGQQHACAVTADGSAWCWGRNLLGRLGDGTTTDSDVPVAVSGLVGATAISAGWDDSCALSDEGLLRCWGQNGGDFGDGSLTVSYVPKDIQRVQALTLSLPSSLVVGTAVDVAGDATASSGLAASFDSWTPDICSVSGTSVTPLAAGLCGIRVAQAGNGSFTTAPQRLALLPVALAPAATYTVGGSVSGLSSAAQVILQNNAGDDLSVSANGSFSFATALGDGSAYAVSVKTQPTGQTCTVSQGSGTVAGANVSNVLVSCVTNRYSIGGTLSGLGSGKQVVLQDNGGDDLSLTADGSFGFATTLAYGASYSVSVKTQPTGQTCVLSQASGTVTGAVSNIVVTCTDDVVETYTLGGTVSGLASGYKLVLRNNGGDALTITANGAFTFPTRLADGASYVVTLSGQPSALAQLGHLDETVQATAQVCAVSGASGRISGHDVSSVSVSCSTSVPTLGGRAEWMLVLLLGMFGAFAVRVERRRAH